MSGRNVAVIERQGDPLAERFLELVAMNGNSAAASRAVGVHRNTFYKRAASDPDFRARWDAAQLQSRRNIAEEVLEKAMVASGRIVTEVVTDAHGAPVLDDDFEPVVVRRLVDVDSRILAKLLDKFVASEDGPPVTAVQVNNIVPEKYDVVIYDADGSELSRLEEPVG